MLQFTDAEEMTIVILDNLEMRSDSSKVIVVSLNNMLLNYDHVPNMFSLLICASSKPSQTSLMHRIEMMTNYLRLSRIR